jgi:hypothetical protein
MSIGVLNYAGGVGVSDMNGFNARMRIPWKGEHLFRVYPLDGQLYFIRVGTGKQTGYPVGGLIGILVRHLANKANEKKVKNLLGQIAGVHPQQLVSGHKVNFVLPVAQIAHAQILPGSFWASNKFGRLQFVDGKKKLRKMIFDDLENMRLAVQNLPPVLGNKLALNVVWDEKKQKYRKG